MKNNKSISFLAVLALSFISILINIPIKLAYGMDSTSIIDFNGETTTTGDNCSCGSCSCLKEGGKK